MSDDYRPDGCAKQCAAACPRCGDGVADCFRSTEHETHRCGVCGASWATELPEAERDEPQVQAWLATNRGWVRKAAVTAVVVAPAAPTSRRFMKVVVDGEPYTVGPAYDAQEDAEAAVAVLVQELDR